MSPLPQTSSPLALHTTPSLMFFCLFVCFYFCGVQKYLVPVVQKVDSAIHWIKIYPVNNAIGFPNTYLLDSDLSTTTGARGAVHPISTLATPTPPSRLM